MIYWIILQDANTQYTFNNMLRDTEMYIPQICRHIYSQVKVENIKEKKEKVDVTKTPKIKERLLCMECMSMRDNLVIKEHMGLLWDYFPIPSFYISFSYNSSTLIFTSS